MKKEISEKILKETERGYDSMAEKFSQTRKYFWRGLEFVGDYVKKGDTVLDFGCGNGRLLELFGGKKINYAGVDVSENLIKIAKEKYEDNAAEFDSDSESNSDMQHFSKITASQTILPFADYYFNTVYSIAVFHHFPSEKYREDVANELYRVTKKDGHVIITVWNLWQKRYIKNILRNWKNKIFGKSNLYWNDCYISFADNERKKFQRFHHAFTKRELKTLFQKAGFEIEKCEIVGGRNILLIAKKKG
jgi:ubiquinone/menaquinone biosynthesis C-methylase UbiE